MYYQVTDFYDPIGQKEISSKCPDCGSQNCLELHFYQKRIETPFSKKVSKKVTGVLVCRNTETEISPVLWTNEIENYFNTEKSKLKLHSTGLKFNKWFYFILIVPTLLILGGIGYSMWEHNTYMNQSASIENSAVGDKVMVMQTFLEKNSTKSYGNTWYQIIGIDSDTIFLKQHADFSNEDGFDFDLEDKNFTGETIKASLPRFKERSVMGFDYTDMKFSGYITDIQKKE
ncbi:hypothetical protein FEE95_14790 [Maribacter algarum]|uniref:Uncharacterized protein n=1 Tax=Maribacter algarum (ex Zhang et al. 2020) TaxID=2578118 RepID=A0A5S3PNB6_9FLAO|nr:hypothetical protein [Maribacter algarum]TMM55913.1 hypothetical protein FEE95_14790 [Maribacter algarum]